MNGNFAFTIARAPHTLALDPTLADPAWAAGKVPDGGGPWINVTTRSPATLATTAYLLSDDKNLYVGFKAEQTGVPVVAAQTTNDVGFGLDDFVGIGLDTSGTGSDAYYFETTPRGVRYEQANENVRFRARWSAAGSVARGSWSAVMIVPLNVIRVPRGGKQTWRFNFVRGVAARGEHISWVWDPIMADAAAGTWPTFSDTRFWAAGSLQLAASAATRPKPRADVYALASVGNDRNLFQQANGTFLPENVRMYGADVSYPLTPTIRFVGTLNPDFSNVEIDQQTIAPQEFQRQLIEYRPFFAQGAAFINAASGPRSLTGTNVQAPFLAFYSPSVGPFDSGAKVEGTFGDQSFGALTFHGYDETSNNTFSDQAYGYQHTLPGGSFIYWSDGVFANHSIAGTDHTIETGAEARDYSNGMIYFFDHSFENGTWVPQGHADFTEFFVDRHKNNLEVNAGYLDISPNYNPIDGYTPNSDIRGPQFETDFQGRTPAIKNYSVFFTMDRFLDESGAVHQADTQLFVNATFPNLFSLDGVGEQVGPASLLCDSGRTRVQRTDSVRVQLHRLSVLSRRRDAAVQSVPTPHRLPRRNAGAGRRQLLVGTVRRQLRAPVHDRHEPPDWAAHEPRPRVRRHLRARVLRRRARLAVAAAHLARIQSQQRKLAVARVARHQRTRRICDADRQQPRDRLSRAVRKRQRTLRELRQPGGGSHVKPLDREVRLPRGRR